MAAGVLVGGVCVSAPQRGPETSTLRIAGAAAALKLPAPAPKAVSGRTVLDLKDASGQARGTVLLDLAGGALTSVAVERFDRP